MRALVVGAAPERGHDGFYAALLGAHDLVVAADAGAEQCIRLGRVPDIAVGDFDSAAPGTVETLLSEGVRVERLAVRKDVSDLDAALDAALAAGAGEITLTAAFSRRLDHTLTALGTLARARSAAACALEPGLAVWALDPSIRAGIVLEGSPGSLVTLCSPTGARGVTAEGFAYPLSDAVLAPLSSFGLSNEMVFETAAVRVSEGLLLVLAPGLRGPDAVRDAESLLRL